MRTSQAKPLAELVAAALAVGRVRLAALGRHLRGDALCQHRIKRAWRFCANRRVTIADGRAGVLTRLARQHRHTPLVVALDGVAVRNFHTLMAAAVCGGRAVPLLWASYPEWQLHKSQNNLEEGRRRLRQALLPAWGAVIVLADRGFGRAELARACRQIGLHFVIRIKPDAGVRHPRYRGRLKDYPVRRGIRRVLREAAYRLSDPVTLNVVSRWKKGLPPKRDEPWFWITDLPGSAVELTELYGRRMAVEEVFRDDKGVRNGWALRQAQIPKAERFDRLLRALALAYGLLVGLGLVAWQRYGPAAWCSNNRARQCSAFTIGRALRERMQLSPAAALAAVLAAAVAVGAKWG